MAKKQIDLGLTGLDELFMDDKERVESQLPNTDNHLGGWKFIVKKDGAEIPWLSLYHG